MAISTTSGLCVIMGYCFQCTILKDQVILLCQECNMAFLRISIQIFGAKLQTLDTAVQTST